MTRVWMHGASGRMGQEIQNALAAPANAGLSFAGGSDRRTPPRLDAADLFLDFSTPEGTEQLLAAFTAAKGVGRKSILVGTTGLLADIQARWRALAAEQGHALLFAPNTSVGVLVVAKTAQALARTLSGLSYDIEITETHHRNKKDAPSGTARFLAEAVTKGVKELTPVFNRVGERHANEIGLTAVRGGGVFGEHEVRLIGAADEITLSHRAFSRQLFADGALVLGAWLSRQNPGIYNLLDIDLDDLRRR